MNVLTSIAEKINPAEKKADGMLAGPIGEDSTLTKPKNENDNLAVLQDIFKEVEKIANIISKKETKKEVKRKPFVEKIEKPVEEPVRKDGEKVTKEAKKKKKKEPAPSPFIKSAEAPVSAAPVEEPAPAAPSEDKKGILEGLIDTLKSLFLPIIAAGGIGAFLSGIFTMILEGLGMGEEGGFFDTLTNTVKTIAKPIIWAFENIIKPVATVILVAVKEFLLGIGIAWDEAKLMMLGSGPIAWGIRKIFGIEGLDKREEEALKKKIYDAKMRKEERMAGYVETVTGKRPTTAPPTAAPAPTPAAQLPAPAPVLQAAPPPPAAKPPAPTPKPVAAAPASPPPAPSIKPTEPTLKPSAPAVTPSGVQGVIVQALKESGITSAKAVGNILATVKAESNFKPQSENLNYTSAERIVKVFGDKRVGGIEGAQQLVKNPEALANKVYAKTDGNSTEGDGYKYRGRGFIQHTGKNQYKAISDFTGLDLTGNPDLLNDPGVAAKAIAWFFLKYKRLSVEQLDNMSAVNRAVAFSDPTGEKARAREQMAAGYEKELSAGGGTMVAQAPTTGQAINTASAEVGSEKNKPRQPTVNVTYVDATKVTTAAKTSYS